MNEVAPTVKIFSSRCGNLIGEFPGATIAEALHNAILEGADLTDADLRGANLTDANPVVPDLHTRMLAAIEAGGVLEMDSWHLRDAVCGTQHCRAGWAIHLAGPVGHLLESQIGSAAAGALIISASCPYLERVPDFYCGNQEALDDIRRCAEIEARAAAAAKEEGA